MGKARIQRPTVRPNQKKIRFSFEYLQLDHFKFPIKKCSREYLEAFFRELLRYQTFSVDGFITPSPDDHRHHITFSETTEPDGFPTVDPSQEEIWTDDPWQFGLPGKKNHESNGWRVHGFISDGIFYIVWLDPLHALDSGDNGSSRNRGKT